MKLSLKNKCYVFCFGFGSSILFGLGWTGLEYLLTGEILVREIDNIVYLFVSGIIYIMWYFFFKYHEVKLRSKIIF